MSASAMLQRCTTTGIPCDRVLLRFPVFCFFYTVHVSQNDGKYHKQLAAKLTEQHFQYAGQPTVIRLRRQGSYQCDICTLPVIICVCVRICRRVTVFIIINIIVHQSNTPWIFICTIWGITDESFV